MSRGRWLTASLTFGIIMSLYGAGKALIALHLHLFSQSFPACSIAGVGDSQTTRCEQSAIKLLSQFSGLAQELALSEAFVCVSCFVLFSFALALVLISRKQIGRAHV